MIKKFRKETIFTLAVILLSCVTVLVVDSIFLTEEGGQVAEAEFADQEQFGEGYIEVVAHVVLVAPVREHLTLELEFFPHSRLMRMMVSWLFLSKWTLAVRQESRFILRLESAWTLTR